MGRDPGRRRPGRQSGLNRRPSGNLRGMITTPDARPGGSPLLVPDQVLRAESPIARATFAIMAGERQVHLDCSDRNRLRHAVAVAVAVVSRLLTARATGRVSFMVNNSGRSTFFSACAAQAIDSYSNRGWWMSGTKRSATPHEAGPARLRADPHHEVRVRPVDTEPAHRLCAPAGDRPRRHPVPGNGRISTPPLGRPTWRPVRLPGAHRRSPARLSPAGRTHARPARQDVNPRADAGW